MPTDASGRLQVVCGPMFAGKSEELLRRAATDLVDLSLALVPGQALAEIDRGQFEAALEAAVRRFGGLR